jgi:Rieske Fe-S protein
VRRAANGTVSALSLLCTHTGCEVRWQPETERWHCPCHQGLFDAAGEVLAGPPPRALRQVAVRVDGDRVVLD